MNKKTIFELAGQLVLAENQEEINLISKKLADELQRESPSEQNTTTPDMDFTGFLKYDNKEISKMPTTLRKYFRAEGSVVYYRKRYRSKNKKSCTYEARYRRHGYSIARTAPTLELLKAKMIEALNEADKQKHMNVPTTLAAFAEYYIENFYKRKVSAQTFKANCNRYQNHIKPYFGEKRISRITSLECQSLLDGLVKQEKFKTAKEIRSILNLIFEMAIRHGIISVNPLDIVILDKYQEKHGKALTKEEEKRLLRDTAGTPYQLMFAIALYTGLRPNEYKTATIERPFIIARNSKRKNGKIEFKKIPITQMLAPYLDGIENLVFFGENRISERFKLILPNHRLYDLRTTFYTRCQECGVSEVALKKFAGHSLGGLADTYTDLSDEFLLKEGAKIIY